MTVEEAIEILESTPLFRMEQTPTGTQSQLGEAMVIAISSLEKQIAKAPLHIQGSPSYGYCPSCGGVVLEHADVRGCRHCLQRLSW